jgi:sulfide:quinone oxidoreductase
VSHVLILGGGFGGLAAARELRTAHSDLAVTLVSAADEFYMGFAKLWDLAGTRPLADGTRSLTALEARGVRFVHADITAIDPARCAAETTAGTIEADALLVALGAGPSPAHREVLSGEGAFDLYDGRELPGMHAALDAVDEGRVLVSILGGPFKCPPAPFEAALLVDELLRARDVRDRVGVAISTPQPITLPVAGPDASRYVAGFLAERDIELFAESPVTAVDGDERRVTFGNGSTADYRVLLGVPASAPPPVVADSGLAAPSGWIEPDRHSLATGTERVYAVGDCTNIPNAVGALPKAGVFAAAQGEVAARNIAADLLGTKRTAFDGHGFCFLELPGEKVAYVEGDFYAEPRPEVTLTEADDDQFRAKQAYEREHLAAWLG